MAIAAKIYTDDVGTLISLDTGLSASTLATATTKEIRTLRPDGTIVTWAGTVNASKVEYVTKAGDLSLAGTYKMQVYLVLPGWTGRGDTVSMKVLAPFK